MRRACRYRLSQPSDVLLTPGVKTTGDGWLNRYLQARRAENATPFRAVALTQQLPRMLQGTAPALAMNQIAQFGIRGQGAAAAFESAYARVREATKPKRCSKPRTVRLAIG